MNPNRAVGRAKMQESAHGILAAIRECRTELTGKRLCRPDEQQRLLFPKTRVNHAAGNNG